MVAVVSCPRSVSLVALVRVISPNPPTTLGSARGRVRVPPLATFRGGAICGAPVATRRGGGGGGAAESPSAANIFLDAFAGARGGLFPAPTDGDSEVGPGRRRGCGRACTGPPPRCTHPLTRRRPTHPRRRRAPPRRRKRAHAPRSVNDTSRSYRGLGGKRPGAPARRSDPAEFGDPGRRHRAVKTRAMSTSRRADDVILGSAEAACGVTRTRPPRGVPRRAGSLTTPDRTCCAVCSWVSCSGWR